MKNTKKMSAKSIVSIATSLLIGCQTIAGPVALAIPAALTASTLATTSALAVNNNLIGCLDIAEVTGNILHVRGWAMDLRQNGPINVHFYVVMKDGREILIEGTLACDGRPDVCIAKGRSTQYGYGYDRTFQIHAGIDVSSIVGVRAYGIDPQNVENQLISAKPLASAPVANASSLDSKITNFLNDGRFRNGAAWASGKRPVLSSYSSTGCCAYAADFVKSVYGINNLRGGRQFNNVDEIRKGDVIYCTPTHWIVVTGRSGNTIQIAEGNWNNKVHTGSYTLSGNQIRSGNQVYKTFQYGYHY